jgi:hypothetical protein
MRGERKVMSRMMLISKMARLMCDFCMTIMSASYPYERPSQVELRFQIRVSTNQSSMETLE